MAQINMSRSIFFVRPIYLQDQWRRKQYECRLAEFDSMTTSSLMASALSSSSSSLASSRRVSVTALSFSSISVTHNPKVHFFKWIPYSGLSSWNGLKQLSISKSQFSVKIGRSRKNKGKGVYASLFGVGAPEALVIGVVALLVFGPKGLAEVARNLGKTLREFQPTIRELQDVSREFKSTLEREIGLDDIKGSVQDTRNSSTMSPSSDSSYKNSVADPTSTAEDDLERMMRIADAEKQAEKDLAALLESRSESQTVSQEVADNSSSSDRAYSTEEYLKISEEQLKAAAQKQSETSTPEQIPFNTQSLSQADSASSADGAYSTEDLSKAAAQQNLSSSQQSPSNAESQSQEAPGEAASMISSSTNPESET
ncbi:sec-independent protein translocase protein TATB, chloroplastic isoform X27 [Solanum lycopersicum]|uniref:sec-independent protein translocase protein TATB, chloroplastic isoform X27 n=1 Tax=Solanum lycopersicum TaxID=4081 RepID=UPI000532EF08|nr:sec-independent protein translocase protein TATB, chloroplastic isoform X12 [Solanum lycopersicum]